MSSKDEFIFKKSALMSTKSGKDILKHIILRETGYKQFHKYSQNNEEKFREFTKRYLLSLHTQIISDPNPSTTMKKFSEEVGSTELDLDDHKIDEVKTRISRPEILADRVDRLLNSNFVVMTFPVLHALFDAASQYQKETIPDEMRNAIIDGHIIAIDLSEPLDRIIDKDEDLDYLDDYKLMCPYILEIARQKISRGGESVLKAFEEGFKDARIGQYIDIKLKTRPESISDENMIGCYKKYRSIMGTAGRNMALNRKPLADIYHLGMAKAGESVGCGNEIQDAIRNGQIKIPSWPLFYAILSGDVKKGFELTIKKGKIYLEEAKLALEILPEDFQYKPFLEFLFLTVSHYNQYWYNELNRRDLFALLQKNMDGTLKV
ncbi:MAG TPA: hypothetical protein VEH06_17130 [Candidatus Bathyarchaeia archaeon]|jgi:hypothetical protein|nr:hypothetical protein [Candidatus Bathyarchaeia archaeon]